MKIIITFLIVFLQGCSSKQEYDSQKLCRDFCTLNKGKKFSILFEISTDERFSKNKPKYIAVYCADVKGFYINIPLKIDEFKNKKLYGSEYFYKCKNSGKEDVGVYQAYINKFNSEYESINVPQYHVYNNVLVNGYPHLGRFIEFTLDEQCKVYYLEDSTSLTTYWKDKFSRFKKVDDKWFYECQ